MNTYIKKEDKKENTYDGSLRENTWLTLLRS